MVFSRFFRPAFLACAAQAALQYKGADWSSVAVLERNGTEYKDTSGTVKPLETILFDSGINIVRQRVWVAKGDYDLDYNIALSKRAKAAGLDVHINLHFSDSWADPGQQRIPAGWPTDIDGLLKQVYDYTLNVSNTLQAEGVPPAIIDLGNEILDGLLWPVGRGSVNWTHTGELLISASKGIRDSDLNPKPKINIHLNGAGDEIGQNYFWGNVLKATPSLPDNFDMFSASFYPFYGPEWNFTRLSSSLTMLTERLPGKDFMVAEVAWPWSCEQGGNYDFPPDMRPSIPFGAEGQRTWLTEVADRVGAVAGGVGIEYWEIAWVTNAGLGQTGCEDNIMFEYEGNARSSLTVFKDL